MDARADSARLAYPLFHAGDDGSRPISALHLFFRPVERNVYADLVRLWHSRLPSIRNSFDHAVCYAAEHDGKFYATAGWSHPVASGLPQTWLELRRFAIAPDSPKNTASRMLGWMVRDIAKRFTDAERVISYQDMDVHLGTIYRAAGWVPVLCGGGGEWNATRKNRVQERVKVKTRWEKLIRTK